LVACAALATAGVSLAGAYGLVLGLAPLASTFAAWGAIKRRGVSGPGPEWAELTTAIGYLVLSAVFAQFLAVAGPFVVKLLAGSGREAAAGRFLASLAMARIPIFLFQAVQPPLLSRLSGLVVRGLLKEFGQTLKRLLVAVGMMGGITIVLAWLIGPWIITTFFGRGFALGRTNLLYLAGGTAAYLVAMALAQALLALSFHTRVAAAWVVGSAVFVLRILMESDIITRVAEGFLLGSAAAAVAMAVAVVFGLRTGPARAEVTVPGPVAQEP
jgi:O-antigen/teichoic acid export membrane protein